jgi:ferredoxin
MRPAADRRAFSLQISACTNCGLCQEACREGAITFAGKITIADLLDDSPAMVAAVSLRFCPVCGDALPAKAGTTCTICERRQLSYGLPYPA